MAPGKSKSNSRDGLRTGKWTPEEEAYVHLLIEEFRMGTLPLSKGTTLRFFLSHMLHCHPKRISKKFERSNYNGKHKYEAGRVPMSLEEVTARRHRLREIEQRYLNAVQREADEQKEAMPDETAAGVVGEEEDSVSSNRGKAGIDAGVAKKEAPAKSDLPRRTTSSSSYREEIQRRMELANQCAVVDNTSASAAIRDMSLSNSGIEPSLLYPGDLSPSSSRAYVSGLFRQRECQPPSSGAATQQQQHSFMDPLSSSSPQQRSNIDFPSLGLQGLQQRFRSQSQRQDSFVSGNSPTLAQFQMLLQQQQQQRNTGTGIDRHTVGNETTHFSDLGNLALPTNFSRTASALSPATTSFNNNAGGGGGLSGSNSNVTLPQTGLDHLSSMRLMAVFAREDQKRAEAAQKLKRDLDVLSIFERLQPGSRLELSESLKRGAATAESQSSIRQQQQQQQHDQSSSPNKRSRFY